MAHYLLTGGTGFIGTALVNDLVADGHTAAVFTRNPDRHRARFPAQVSLVDSLAAIPREVRFDGVVNLAGAGIADKRWSEKRKRELIDSHAGVTRELVRLIGTLETRPAVMVSGSAVGWYGSHGDEPLDEQGTPHEEFSHELCRAWEEAAEGVRDHGVRLCIVRLGPVLEKHGGMLQRLLPPFRLGLGGRLGDGRQYLSWVHLRDVVRGIRFLLDNPTTQGVYNLTAPVPVSNREFTRELARVLRRPALLPLPAPVIRAAFGEMGEALLLHGQNVLPMRLNRAGFIFDHERIEEALVHIITGKPFSGKPA